MSSLNPSDFTYIEGGRNLENEGFVRNEWMQVHEVQSYREKNNNIGLYTTAYRYDTDQIAEANLYGDFYLDFDNEEDFEKVRKDVLDALFILKQPFTYNIPIDLVHIFFSGKKGIHLIIPAEVLGIEPNYNLNEYYKFMAEELASLLDNDTLDTRIYDRRRLLRLPNSRHQDTGYYKVPLSYEELKTLSLVEIKNMATQVVLPYKAKKPYEITKARKAFEDVISKWKNRFEKQFNKNRSKDAKPLGFTPACTQELIESGPRKGQRNNTAAVLVSHWIGEGLSEQEVWDKLVSWNQESLSERELRNTLKSVQDGGYRYGCTTLEKLATCVEHECPLWKGKQY